jgi:DNA polymerase-1
MKRLFIIDGNSYIYRAYHAIRGLKNSEGFPTNAIYGFTNMLVKIMQESPDYIAVIFDKGKKTFRNEIYSEYKATRPPMPDELVMQIPFIKDVVKAFNLSLIEQEGLEADDLIAAIVKKFKNDTQIFIITSDKDLTQLIDKNVLIWDTLKDKKIDENNIKEKFGVEREYIIDYLSLIGDKSDNIPGVKGIGPKAAVKLINEFGSLENIYKNIDKIENKRIANLLKENMDNAFLSKRLIKLKDDIEISIDTNSIKVKEPNYDALKNIFTKFDFTSLQKKYSMTVEKEKFSYNFVNNFPSLNKIAGVFYKYKDGLFEDFIAGFSDNGKDIFITDDISNLKKLKNKTLLCFNAKSNFKIFENCNNEFPENFEDIQLIAYILDPDEKNSIEHITKKYTGKHIKPIEDYKEKKNVKINFSKLQANDKKEFLSERVCGIFNCYEILSNKITDNLQNLYNSVEKPLTSVLYKMEKNGIYINKEKLKGIGKELTVEIENLTNEIFEISGEKFNINSPLQLRKILFEKLNLDIIKKTKTGPSTDNEVLEVLSAKHPLPKLILEYREKAKLQSTYIEGLLKLIDEKTSRIYPTFQQTITATGRLSCTNPNIQNIPIRTENGNKIREAFAAPEGKKIISLDYSQIELRVMAHFSEDPELIKAFEDDIDVHTLTASKIYKVDIFEVDEVMRREGKTVNFAIIYGISPFGLAKSLKITRDKAKTFIGNYFKEYSGVKNYIENMVNFAKDKGYVETILGRIRYIKGITSRNHNEREFAKRIAVNTPIQGSSADLIKLAMLKIDKICKEFDSKMIMQVHDELIFEVNEICAEQFAKKAQNIMEQIYPKLKVKLKVDYGIGDSWFEAH